MMSTTLKQAPCSKWKPLGLRTVLTAGDVVESMALRPQDHVEQMIMDRLHRSHATSSVIEEAALPYIANILTPNGALDRRVKKYLEGTVLAAGTMKSIAVMAREGSRTKVFAVAHIAKPYPFIVFALQRLHVLFANTRSVIAYTNHY